MLVQTLKVIIQRHIGEQLRDIKILNQPIKVDLKLFMQVQMEEHCMHSIVMMEAKSGHSYLLL